jgi:hypothetical protein
MTAERARLHKLLRGAILLQAIGLLGIIALTFPDWLDGHLRPYASCGFCLDLRGLAFVVAATFLGPIIVLLLVMAWRWRGPRRWPLAIVGVVDAAAIFATAAATVSFVHYRSDSIPPYASAPSFLLLPALVTLALGVSLLRPLRLRRILAASAGGCVLLTALLWFFAIRPVQQSIPGELSLPFSRTTVYEGRSLGCQDHVQGWVDEHQCLRATLLVYRGSGDASKDQATINGVLVAQRRIRPVDENVTQLPVDMAVNRTYVPDVDPSNAGLCVIITDRSSPPPSPFVLGRCGMVTDYADIRTSWPGNDTYAIGIIYYFDRRDYIGDHSVTFLNTPLSARPGQSAVIRVHADANTRCSIVVFDASGLPIAQGLDPKTTDAAGEVEWIWLVDASTKPGQWPITVTCGASTGRSSWFVYGP